MIRHVVLFTWTEEATDEQKTTVAKELSGLQAVIPQIRTLTLGADAGINQGNYDFAVVADFDSEADYLVYRDDTQHQEIIVKHIRPIMASRAAIQFGV
jgi:hypothetical protein